MKALYYLIRGLHPCPSIIWIPSKPVVHYLGAFVDCHLNWNDHCEYIAAKATRSLNFLHHCLFNCPVTVKLATYKCIVQPITEYACPVWFLHTAKNINTLERVQHRATRWAAGSRWDPFSYCWSKSLDDFLTELKWPSIHQRYTYFSICQVHNIFHSRNFISFSDYFQLTNASTRSHPLTIRPVSSLTVIHFC